MKGAFRLAAIVRELFVNPRQKPRGCVKMYENELWSSRLSVGVRIILLVLLEALRFPNANHERS